MVEGMAGRSSSSSSLWLRVSSAGYEQKGLREDLRREKRTFNLTKAIEFQFQYVRAKSFDL